MVPPYWLLAILGPVLVLGQAYNFGFKIMGPIWNNNTQVVVGRLPLSPDGSVPLRLEIRELMKDQHKWDLFILAMNTIQDMDQDDLLSFYQLAGIHGVPFAPWNNVEPVAGGENSGYCTHSSVLFPMWHRPYLALFEQQLYRVVNKIANLYPRNAGRAEYLQAAADFRMPYWDWAAPAPEGDTQFPKVFWEPQIFQNGPRGLQYIRNPLFSYEFHPLYDGVMPWTPLKWWSETKRAPDLTMGNKNPPSVNRKVSEALQGKLTEIQQRLFILFSSYKNFNAFSNKVAAMQQGLSSWDSIESIHDIIHIYGGLKGHMTYVPLSSFDPMFFLHHTNTDRLVAMWQALNPTAWITPMAAGETSFTTLKGTMQDSTTPLTPFLISPEGDFWTSDLARVPEMFGYSYADTDVSNTTSGEVRSRLVSNIVKWYGGSSPLSIKANIKPTLPNRAHIEMPMNSSSKAVIPNLKGSMHFTTPASVFEDGHYTEWVANVRVNVEALDGLFGVHFFLGEPPEDTGTWDTASNEIGSVGIFAMNRNTGSKSMISGTLPLTTALLRLVSAGIISDVAPEAAQDWLQKNLRFAIKGSDDRVVDPEKEEVAGLYIMVTSSDVNMPSPEQPGLPVWDNPIQRFEMWT